MNQQSLQTRAVEVLDKNDNGAFIRPAPSLYPHQWNWDAGFIALGLARTEWELAVRDMRHLFSGQWSNGLLPHIIFGDDADARYFPGPDFWQTERSPDAPETPRTSGITQPPVHGFVIWELYRHAPDPAAGRELLAEFFPKIKALHHYLYSYRDPEEEGLVYVRHPWEAGTDNSPYWDRALARLPVDPDKLPPYTRQDLQHAEATRQRPTRTDYDRYVWLVDLFRQRDYDEAAIQTDCPFQIQDPLFNGLLVWSNECLINMGAALGEDVLDIIQWNELTVHSLNEKLWNEEAGLYQAYDLIGEESLPLPVNSAFVPMVGLVPTQEQAERLLQQLETGTFGDSSFFQVPTYSPRESAVDFARYWRGPVWINLNWLIYRGLRRYDMLDMAQRIREDSLRLLADHGFFEYFDPRKDIVQAGYGTHQFSWSAALCLDWLAGDEEEE